jgi:hypothetical protein
MKLSSRSYPHPVVGNRDDVPGAAFQAALEMSSDKQAIYIDATVKCSSKTINDLVKKKDASLVLHVECSNTLFRKTFEFSSGQFRAQIPADNLNDSVEVNVFAKANRNISGYKVDASHPDYGTVSFDVEKGNILAIGEGQVFYIDSQFDAMSPIGSIMEIHEAHPGWRLAHARRLQRVEDPNCALKEGFCGVQTVEEHGRHISRPNHHHRSAGVARSPPCDKGRR